MSKPVLIFDGDCVFCAYWVGRLKRHTGEQVDYVPYQEVGDRFPNISKEEFQVSVKLVQPDGEIFSAAEAVFRTLAYSPKKFYRLFLWSYQEAPGFKAISEMFYRFVARHRKFFSSPTKF